MSPVVGQIALGVYAVLLGAGGVMGFVKARSRPSLIAGSVSAVIALIALVMTLRGGLAATWNGFFVGLLLAFVLALVFLRRLGLTGKPFPAGLIAGVSVLVAVLMVLLLGQMAR